MYAMRTTRGPRPDALESGCPQSGWIHAGGGPPWRVVAEEDPEYLRAAFTNTSTGELFDGMTGPAEYDGGEPTCTVREWHPDNCGCFRCVDPPKQ